MIFNSSFGGALDSQINPKAIQKIVSSFMTANAVHNGTYKTVNSATVASLGECLSQYIAKDGTYNTNITVSQFYTCCINSLKTIEQCITLTEDVVFEHNTLSGQMRPAKTPCTPEDLRNINYNGANLATAGYYIMVNGVKKCAATKCKDNWHVKLYPEGHRYAGKSMGICEKDKTVVKNTVVPDAKEEQANNKQHEQQTLQEEKIEVIVPNSAFVEALWKKYCEGSGEINCTKKLPEQKIITAFKCDKTKTGIDMDRFSQDANAVCNGTYNIEPDVTEQESDQEISDRFQISSNESKADANTNISEEKQNADLVGKKCDAPYAKRAEYDENGKCIAKECLDRYLYTLVLGECIYQPEIQKIYDENNFKSADDWDKYMQKREKQNKKVKEESDEIKALRAKLGTDCTPEDLKAIDKLAVKGTYQVYGGRVMCVISKCAQGEDGTEYVAKEQRCISIDKAEKKEGKPCNLGIAKIAKAAWKNVDGEMLCVVQSCQFPNRYEPEHVDNPTSCVKKGK